MLLWILNEKMHVKKKENARKSLRIVFYISLIIIIINNKNINFLWQGVLLST